MVIFGTIFFSRCKLNSVDELKNIKLDTTSASNNASSNASNPNDTNVAPFNNQQPTDQLPPPVVEAVQEQISYKKVSEDDRYRLYFRMLKMVHTFSILFNNFSRFYLNFFKGVAEEAVRTKMKAEGIDPDLLSNPDAPAPPAPPASSDTEE